MANQYIIAVDPGQHKCGVAVVARNGAVGWKAVVSTSSLAEVVAELALKWQVTTVVIGDRTAYKAAKTALESIFIDGQPLVLHPVDEHRSSDEAKGRYWLDHKPHGLLWLIPLTMRTPPVPVDDYVAVILAERHFARSCLPQE
jgi:hypothetical protein